MSSPHAHDNTIYLKDYSPPEFLIEKIYLHVDIQEDHTTVKAILHVIKNSTSPDLTLMGEALALQSVSLNGKVLSQDAYRVTDKTLIIFNVPDQFSLETSVLIYPQKNTQLMGLYQSRQNLCTQCEAEGFRRITYYLDRPDVMAYFTTTISADKKQFPILLSNGNLIEKKSLSHDRHWVRWEDPSKKPCYLFALVAGDFDVMTDQFITLSHRTIQLYLYLEKGFLDQGAFAMQSLKNAMQWDEKAFGREYDLNQYMIVAVSDFNMGAMENKGLNIFNTKYILAKPETATDQDYMHIESVIGHEYFHNWSGNRITCRDWFQLTLKEGLTVFREQLFTEERTSAGVARIDVVNAIRNQQFPEDKSPMAHPIRPDNYMKIDNFYTSTVYYKGAEVIRMIRTLITPTVFRQGMDIYFSEYDGQAVTTEDFLAAMEKASGKDLSQFKLWYEQAGTPVLHIDTHYDAIKKTYAITVKQTCAATPGQPNKKPFYMPLAMGLIGTANAPQTTHILAITKSEETFLFTNIAEKPVPSLLRYFSAPVELQYHYTNEECAWLLQHDSDPFCRWEAAQRLAISTIRAIAHALLDQTMPSKPTLLIDSFQTLLSHPPDDLYFLAHLLNLPTLNYLLTHIDADLEIIFKAKCFVEKAIAVALEKTGYDIIQKNSLAEKYVFDMKSSGQRALKNQCLYYLLHTQKESYFEFAYQQVLQANNMTDKLGALEALNPHETPWRAKALDYFYQTYQHEPLVVNKWLILQASSTLPSAFSDVKKLSQHPAFDIHNPNNVYALLVTFGENTLRFHARDGKAYPFLSEKIIQIDQYNPQVAARLIKPFTRWQQMDNTRGAHMKVELEKMATTKNISENLFEIVKKSLGV